MAPISTITELERTYLAKKLPSEISGKTPHKLIDVYVPESGSEHPRLRLRQKDTLYEMTKKVPVVVGDASIHHETTIPLDKVEFLALCKASNKRIVKERYCVKIDDYDAEVDVFKENLEGLVLIDFEFESEKQKNSFVPPAICLGEVTQEDFIAGGLLAGKKYEDIENNLKKFNYKKIQSC